MFTLWSLNCLLRSESLWLSEIVIRVGECVVVLYIQPVSVVYDTSHEVAISLSLRFAANVHAGLQDFFPAYLLAVIALSSRLVSATDDACDSECVKTKKIFVP